MNRVLFIERLERFNVSPFVKKKYYGIYEQIAGAEELSAAEIKERLERISFAGYLRNGNQLMTGNAEIDESYRRGDYNLCLIPYNEQADLLGLRTVRIFRSAPDLKQIGITRVYTVSDFPYLTMETVVSQLTPAQAEKTKAFALRLKDDFVETGYLNLAQAYEYQIELLG